MDRNSINHVFLGKGRINRRQFLILSFLGYVFLVLALSVGTRVLSDFSILVLNSVIAVLLGLFFIPLLVRRGHDIGLPGYIGFLLGGVSFLGLLTSFYLGLLPKNIVFMIMFIYSISMLLTVIYMIFLVIFSGKSNNKYGEQPKDLKKVSEIIRFWWTGQS